MKRSSGLLALSAIAAACGGFLLSGAQGQVRDDGVDPSTPYGQSVIQNEQNQRQEQLNEQQSRQNQEEQQQRDQTFREQQNQPAQGYYQAPGPGGPSFGAIYVGVGVKPVVKYSYNYPTLISAKAAARQACQAQAGAVCKEALAIKNTCGAIAVAPNGLWASRSDDLDVKAADEALGACKATSKHECDLKAMYCVPNNN
jgi:hypothetical protein